MSESSPEHQKIFRGWIEKAEHDLRTAEHTLKLKKDCPFDTVCFHAQQCVEKYIKAYLTSVGVDFPKTHDLTELVALLPKGKLVEIDSLEMAALNPYAIETRYPGEWETQSREEALQAIRISRRIRGLVRKELLHK